MYIRFTIKMLPDEHPNRFMNHRWAMTHGGINLAEYRTVYCGEIEARATPAQTLEDIFSMLNYRRPANYHARSLSVSDVVWLEDTGTYFCDSVGFQQLA